MTEPVAELPPTGLPTGATPLPAPPGDELVGSAPDAAGTLEAVLEPLRPVLAHLAQGAVVTDLHGRVVVWNAAAAELLGWRSEETVGRTSHELGLSGLLPEQRHSALPGLSSGELWAGDVVTPHRDGSALALSVTVLPLGSSAAGQVGVLALLGREAAVPAPDPGAHGAGDSRYRRMVESALDGIATIAPDGRFETVNPELAAMLGRTQAELVGAPAMDFIHPEDPTVMSEDRSVRRRNGIGEQYEVTVLRPDGSRLCLLVAAGPLFEDDGAFAGSLCLATDITTLKSAQQALTQQALHDPLTGLPNRTLLDDRLEQACRRRPTTRGTVAVMLVDIDDFKDVNDAQGHAAGDAVLRRVADQLQHALRPEDTVSRHGGDEFVVLVEAVAGGPAAEEIAARVHAALATPVPLAGQPTAVSVSIGIALREPDDDQEPSELLRDADAAMYEAKRQGGRRTVLFDESLRRAESDRQWLRRELRTALDAGDLALHAQPVVDLRDGTVVGVEALSRWTHPERGLLAPASFIPVAEGSGLIVELGAWALREACRQAAQWRRAGLPPLYVAVNVSAHQLAQQEVLLQAVVSALSESGLPADALVLEVTENSVMAEAEAALEGLAMLHRLGLRLALDDFGTGFSSLAYLRRFPFAQLKVDRSLVQGLGTTADDGDVVAALVGVARSLRLDAVGEGVEHAAQRDALRRLGCRYGQGFLWSPPVSAEQLPDLLRRGVGAPGGSPGDG